MAERAPNAGFRSNAEDVGLPPLLDRRADVYAYYRLEFLPDGYPGRRTEHGLHAHPIYGTYIIADYLAQFVKTRSDRYLAGAIRVADAAISRMEPHRGGLAFWYEPASGISSLPVRFYSALTQARYLQVLAKLNSHTTDERFRAAAQRIFKSLLVPVEEGGVMRRHPPGMMIEEYAHQYPDYTLNGWTTAMLLVHEYGQLMAEPEATAFFHSNVAALRDVIHLYDVPELATSRYRLTGPAAIRLNFDAPGPVIRDGRVIMPNHGEYPIANTDAGRWESRYRSGIGPDGTVHEASVLAELYLSMVTAPTPNIVALSVGTPRRVTLRVAIGQGRYRTKSSYLAARSFVEFASFELEPGNHDIAAEIPWEYARLVAYPTTFGKVIGGRSYNQYHFIHVANLEKLFALTGEQTFDHWAGVWRAYPLRWRHIPEYDEAEIALERYEG